MVVFATLELTSLMKPCGLGVARGPVGFLPHAVCNHFVQLHQQQNGWLRFGRCKTRTKELRVLGGVLGFLLPPLQCVCKAEGSSHVSHRSFVTRGAFACD